MCKAGRITGWREKSSPTYQQWVNNICETNSYFG